MAFDSRGRCAIQELIIVLQGAVTIRKVHKPLFLTQQNRTALKGLSIVSVSECGSEGKGGLAVED